VTDAAAFGAGMRDELRADAGRFGQVDHEEAWRRT
jgi:hypothetical protein